MSWVVAARHRSATVSMQLVLLLSQNGFENAEWVDDDEVDGSFEKVEEDTAIPIIDISEHLKNLWTLE
ncbi:hypothetical protein KQX54_000118 [Cotesia glomerata]|uniref:Uncharacterized protein n=1 Tax=Cotesia glomerata TaxID=32391 RepID=A0AAV7I3W2_COTGL|nr:hypothetical protein KQX54_000118 [Cotesia glomerata]